MARYELGTEFWEITQDGVNLIIIDNGKETVRKFVAKDKAEVQYVKLVGTKLAAGYVLVEKKPPSVRAPDPKVAEARDPALEAAILANPYDESAYSVYGDWLQSKGEPRGELIALQLAEEADPESRTLAAVSRTFLVKHARVFTTGLDKHLDLTEREGEPAIVWRFGFIHRITLERMYNNEVSTGAVLADVLQHPSGRFVAEISVREQDSQQLDDAIEALIEHAPQSLRELKLIGFGALGSFDPLVKLPLARLTVKSSQRNLESEPLQDACLRTIAGAPATLETLRIRFGGDENLTPLAPLFVRTDLTRLRTLALCGYERIGELVRWLVKSPFAHQLVTLDFGLTAIERDALAPLADRATFPALKKLRVAFDRVLPRQTAAIKALGIKLEDHRTDPDDNWEDPDPDYYEGVAE